MKNADKESLMREREREAWKAWNAAQRPVRLSPEQCLEWLDGWREFMFELWQKNPHLRAEHERLRAKGVT